jgi:hypothetical protein
MAGGARSTHYQGPLTRPHSPSTRTGGVVIVWLDQAGFIIPALCVGEHIAFPRLNPTT